MRFKRRLAVETGLQQFDIIPLVNCVLLVLFFFVLISRFMVVPGINVKLPKTINSDVMNAQTCMLVITKTGVITWEGREVGIIDLPILIKKERYMSVFIKADRTVDLGIIVNIWGICRKSGIENIGLATTQE